MPSAEKSLFHFDGYRITHFLFQNVRQGPDAEALHYNIGIETSAETMPADPTSQSSGKQSTLVGLRIWLEWQPAPGPFVLEIHGDGVFQSSLDMPADQYRDLCEIHGPALIYTQFRPLARMIASEAGETFQLPLINIGETVKRSRRERAMGGSGGLPPHRAP